MFALISSRSGSQSAMTLGWALQGHHSPLVTEFARAVPRLITLDNNKCWDFDISDKDTSENELLVFLAHLSDAQDEL